MSNAISNQAAPSDLEKKIRGFIEGVLLTKPEMKDRLSVAACVNYLQLPDTTFGWDAYKEQGKAMPIEYKFACLLPTIINDLSPGDICWLGNRPYAKASAYETAAERKLRAISGISFRKLTDDEKEMYGILPADLAVVASQTVQLDGLEFPIEGLGIIGADESQKNKAGNYKVARELTRDRAQFVRTRAIRDMRRRIITIGAVPFEDDYEPPVVEDTAQPEPQYFQKFFDKKESEKQEAIDNALESEVAILVEKVRVMGFDPWKIITDDMEAATMLSLLKEWIETNTPPPEPPPAKAAKPKREKKPKAEAAPVTIEVTTEVPGSAVMELPPGLTIDQSALHHVRIDLEMDGEIIASNYTHEEISNIEASEPHIEFDIEEMDDPIYEGTADQKRALRDACVAAGIPINTVSYMSALAGAMQGQPMSKLASKAAAFRKGISDKNLAGAQPKPAESSATVLPTAAQKEALRNLIHKVEKLGYKPDAIAKVKEVWDVWDSGNAEQVIAATMNMQAWCNKFIPGK